MDKRHKAGSFPFISLRPAEIVNLALGQATIQSSQSRHYGSGLAVDGNPNPDHNDETCTHTAGWLDDPWWQVDLGVVAKVSMVTMVNRNTKRE